MMRRFLFSFLLISVILLSRVAAAERLAVSDPVANVRSGPGTHYSIIWKVEKFHPLLVLEKSGEWIQFSDYENNVGWIHRSLVAEIPAVITKTTKCNVRSGPSLFSRKLATVGKGIPFKVLKEEGEWLNIQHAGGFIGWIHKSLVW